MRILVIKFCLLLLWLFVSTWFCTPDLAADDFELGRSAANAGNFGRAIEIWLPLAEKGHAGALHNLGRVYARGDGVKQDYRRAHQYFLEAAKRGHSASAANLSMMYTRGDGVAPNAERAKYWRKISEEKQVSSMANAGNKSRRNSRKSIAKEVHGEAVTSSKSSSVGTFAFSDSADSRPAEESDMDDQSLDATTSLEEVHAKQNCDDFNVSGKYFVARCVLHLAWRFDDRSLVEEFRNRVDVLQDELLCHPTIIEKISEKADKQAEVLFEEIRLDAFVSPKDLYTLECTKSARQFLGSQVRPKDSRE